MVKCRDCGFVCMRRLDNNELVEVPEHLRKKGNLSASFERVPRCFVMAFPLLDEMGKVGDETDPNRDRLFVEVINKDRACPKFYPWMQGFSPKEHREMLHEKTLMEIQAEQRERDKRFQEDLRREERNWQQDQKAQDRRFQMKWWVVTWLVSAVFGPIVGAIITLGAAHFQ